MTQDNKKNNWIKISTPPESEGYYEVKFNDGTTDEKPYRIRPTKNIKGFMAEQKVVAWRKTNNITN